MAKGIGPLKSNLIESPTSNLITVKLINLQLLVEKLPILGNKSMTKSMY